MSVALAEPAVRHEAAHVARRAAAYVPSLLRFAPDRKPPSDTSADICDPWRRVRRVAHDMQGATDPMNRARFMSASLELSLAEQRVAGSLELARHRGDVVACRSLEQAGNHLCSLRAILAAQRLETLEAEPAKAPAEWAGAWAQPSLPLAAGAE
jgi:hypothetical protein